MLPLALTIETTGSISLTKEVAMRFEVVRLDNKCIAYCKCIIQVYCIGTWQVKHLPRTLTFAMPSQMFDWGMQSLLDDGACWEHSEAIP